jgi:hypothetical protein
VSSLLWRRNTREQENGDGRPGPPRIHGLKQVDFHLYIKRGKFYRVKKYREVTPDSYGTDSFRLTEIHIHRGMEILRE